MIASLSAKRATSEVTRSESIGLLSHSGFFATSARRAFAFSLKRRTSCARSWNFLRDAGVIRPSTAAVRSSRPYATSATSGTSVFMTLPMLQLSIRMSMNFASRGTTGAGLLCCNLFPTLRTTSGFFGKSSEVIRAAGGLPTHSGCVSGKFA